MNKQTIADIYNDWVDGDDTSVEGFADRYGYTVPEAVQLLVIARTFNDTIDSGV